MASVAQLTPTEVKCLGPMLMRTQPCDLLRQLPVHLHALNYPSITYTAACSYPTALAPLCSSVQSQDTSPCTPDPGGPIGGPSNPKPLNTPNHIPKAKTPEPTCAAKALRPSSCSPRRRWTAPSGTTAHHNPRPRTLNLKPQNPKTLSPPALQRL